MVERQFVPSIFWGVLFLFGLGRGFKHFENKRLKSKV